MVFFLVGTLGSDTVVKEVHSKFRDQGDHANQITLFPFSLV